MAQWLWLRAFQTVHYRNTFKIKFHFFYTISCKIPFKIILNYYFLLFFTFLQLKKIKSNSLLTVWYALRPSQQPTDSPNYSQSIRINMGPSDGGTILLSTHRPTILYLRLSDITSPACHRCCYCHHHVWFRNIQVRQQYWQSYLS